MAGPDIIHLDDTSTTWAVSLFPASIGEAGLVQQIDIGPDQHHDPLAGRSTVVGAPIGEHGVVDEIRPVGQDVHRPCHMGSTITGRRNATHTRRTDLIDRLDVGEGLGPG